MRQCVDFEILDDNIANEINETFMGVFDLPAIPGVRDGGIPETTIVILDNDGSYIQAWLDLLITIVCESR